MAIDMTQFYRVFFEEAEEHLSTMEQLLLEADLDAPDDEQMNAIFRAAHSIKGSAGTFGFHDVAQVTHELETLLDLVRKGELALTVAMVDASLEAGDLLRNLLAAHRGEADADTAAVARVCDQLKMLSRAEQASNDGATAHAADAGATPYLLEFMPDARTLADPQALDNLWADLAAAGDLNPAQRPPADSGLPWKISIRSRVDAAALREPLEFIAVPGSIRIDTMAEPLPDADDGSYGFFTDTTVTTGSGGDDDSFGLFEEGPAAAGDAPDGSYGFFAPVAAVEAVNAPEVVPPVVAASPGETSARPSAVATARKSANDSGSIRVGVEKVDQMINLVGELVITQAMIAQAADTLDPVVYERLMNGIAQLERNTRDLQESVMSIRMMPISVVFSRFPRVVRDVSGKLGKQVRLVLSGETTELDRGLIERITDPLTHLVRNSLDHGIESPADRLAKGKPEEGTISLAASHQGGNIVIEVRDDGAGLNRDKILGKARERGLAVHDNMSDQDVWQLIFEPGFSTADQVTEVSGRGVGMDVVKKNISAMGGRVDIESMLGVGTRMTVRLPLTLAILDGMSVDVAGETYIMPLSCVIESLQPDATMIKSIAGVDRLIHVRGEYLPVIVLEEFFRGCAHRCDVHKGIMVVIEADGVKAALYVDALIGQHQVVIKNLEANYRRVRGISGATIMGDGRVAMILDVGALVDRPRASMPVAA